jgi:CHRD domain
MKKLAPITLAFAAALVLAATAFAANKTFTVTMTGKAETPKGAPKGKGTAKITLEPSVGKVCYRLTWSGIGTPTASHIHQGKKGTSGPIVIPLFAPTPKHSGCVKAPKSLIKKIIKHPGGYYVNVHTKKYPAGAIRAQL